MLSGDCMNDNLKIVGNINNLNVSIYGPSQSGKTKLGKVLKEQGFYYLDIKSLKDLEIKIDIIKEFLKFDNYECCYTQDLILMNIIELINSGNNKIIFDDLLIFLNKNIRKKLFKTLKFKNIKFINITTDEEDLLETEYLIVMFNYKVALEGFTLEVLKEEKLLKRMGLSLPFMVDISIQLQYYGLINNIYLNIDELVGELWK